MCITACLLERNNIKYLVEPSESEMLTIETGQVPLCKLVLGDVAVEDVVDQLVKSGLGSSISVSTRNRGSSQLPLSTKRKQDGVGGDEVPKGCGNESGRDAGGVSNNVVTVISVSDTRGNIVGRLEITSTGSVIDSDGSAVPSVNPSVGPSSRESSPVPEDGKYSEKRIGFSLPANSERREEMGHFNIHISTVEGHEELRKILRDCVVNSALVL